MDYEMEELIPIVGRLAEKYTGFESSSVTYEKAEQLMGAVLYCIREAERTGRHLPAAQGRMSAQRAYELGVSCVEEKVKAALGMYHEILPGFLWYGNRCLYDTFVKGMPEFFKWYDIRFHPQDTILSLDYPVLQDLSEYEGIDRIYEYLVCIRLEQGFLRKFPEGYVVNALAGRDDFYQDMVGNLCGIVFEGALGHILAKKPLPETDFGEADYRRVQELLSGREPEEIRRLVEEAAQQLLEGHFGKEEDLRAYLMRAVGDVSARLKNAAEHGALDQLF